MAHRTQISIIDRHEVYRKGLRMVIRNLEADLIAEGTDSSDLLTNPSFQNSDVILMDIGIQCSACGEHLRRFRRIAGDTKVIGLVQHFEQVRIDEMKGAGIDGFLLKNTGRNEVKEAIETVRKGEFYLPLPYKNLITQYQ